jgi:predicted RNase H-like HicB family nuclease
MTNHAVALKITPYLRIECKFWLADDGWNGTCDDIPLTVQAASFEQAKSDMELALGKHMEALLRDGTKVKSEQAA